jgi:hypothetical protein
MGFHLSVEKPTAKTVKTEIQLSLHAPTVSGCLAQYDPLYVKDLVVGMHVHVKNDPVREEALNLFKVGLVVKEEGLAVDDGR